jgi:adenosylhomocysteine nucleosidase
LSGVGVVAALASEARALGPSMPRGGLVPLSELAVLGDGALLAVSGIGRAAARAAAIALVEAGSSALMTFGLAGALDPALEPGSVVVPREVLAADGTRYQADASWRSRVAAVLGAVGVLTESSLLTADRAIESPADKAAAFQSTGAIAVDMESAAVAQIAAQHNLPFIAVRVIVDTAADKLPRAVVAASRAGRVKFGRLIAGLVVAPGQIVPLIRLARRYRVAMRSLLVVGSRLE